MASHQSPSESQVIVITGLASHSTSVHHRDFPEIRSEGPTPDVAATHLIHQLTRALDSALTQWRRDVMNQAIADVQAFVAESKRS